ncbi:hypothetical protein TRVL_08313 [Trypanosoma vivax]|nr:hypothetical protein TRVL_08313 [Trypanosoma vivax]
MRAFVEKHGQTFISCYHRPRADVGVAHADGFLRLENGELLLFENKQVNFIDLRNAMVPFEVPKSDDFIRTFEATKECFHNERRALEESRSALDQQYEVARLHMHEERQTMRGRYAAEDGEANVLRQRICQLDEQIQHMAEHIQSIRDANGVLAAENGVLKAGRVQAATETRDAKVQRGEPNTQLAQRWAYTVFRAPTTGEQQQQRDAPLTSNVWFRAVPGLWDELRETSFKPQEKIRTCEGALA